MHQKMQQYNPMNVKFTLLLFLTLISIFLRATEGKNPLLSKNITSTNKNYALLQRNATMNSPSTFSPWLMGRINPRFIGCRRRPWICNQEYFPKIRLLCCRNRCVDITSDPNNCGLCGIRCPFTWQCCKGLCVNTNVNPFNCGRCGSKCPFPSFCIYGICNYAQPLPPFPFPPRPPFPPKPFPPRPPFPPEPFPPRPPFPPEPFPPRSFPPEPFPPKPFPPPKEREPPSEGDQPGNPPPS